jgi:signal transduction histidine kinase
MYELIRMYFDDGPDSAIYYDNLLMSLSERIGYKKGLGDAYNGLGLINMVGGRNYPLAIESFQKAIKIRTEIGDKEGLGWTYNNMGMMYSGEGKYPEAIQSHATAIKFRTEIGDKEGACESYKKMGASYAYLGNYSKASGSLMNALKLAEETGNKVSIQNIYRTIGDVYESERNYSDALKYYIASTKIRDKIDNKFDLGNNYYTSGKIYLVSGDTVKALKKYFDALKAFEETCDGYCISDLNTGIGNINFYQGNYDEALNQFMKSLNIREALKDICGITNINIQIAEVYNKQNNYPKALSFINTGLSLALESGNKNAVKDAYKNLSEIYEKQNDFKSAYQYHVLFQQIKDTLLNTENASNMKQLGMQYDFDHDAAINKLEQDKKDALIMKEAENQKLKHNIIYAGLALLVIFLVVLIFLRRKIANERRQKALELERIRISRDLHDDLGSGLTKISMMSQVAGKISGEQQQGTLQKITDESSEMIDMMNGIIWAMNTQNDSLLNLVLFLNNTAFELFEDAPIKLTWEAPDSIPEIPIHGITRRNIYLVVKEALHNVLKYSEARQVVVKLIVRDNELNISIEDNGKGFDLKSQIRKENGGNGLPNMKKRMEDIKGSFDISSELNAGTKVSISCFLKHYTKV